MNKKLMGYQVRPLLLGILAAGVLVGCGGGGSSGNTGGSNNTPTPQPVQCTSVQYLDGGVCKNKATQTITGLTLPALSVGDQATLTATASSGLPVTYGSKTRAVCTVSGNQVTAVTAEVCTVVANQAGDNKTLAAAEVSATALIKPVCNATQYLDTATNNCIAKASQTITGLSLPSMSVGSKTNLNAKASSGLAISYSSKTADVCTVVGGEVTAIKAGECSIAANQAGNTRTLAAAEVVAKASVSAPVTASGLLTKTGITTCGNNTTNGLPCTPEALGALYGLDQDGEVQAGQAMSYTVLNRNSARCVQDNVTGLIWEQKTADGGLRDKDWTYAWYNPNSATNGGNAGESNGGTCFGARCDTAGYVAALNAANYCGYSDWRMPTRMELIGLVDFSRVNPSINPVFANTQSVWYWSASPLALNGNGAWAVDFGNGYTNYDFSKGNRFRVRVVRAGQ